MFEGMVWCPNEECNEFFEYSCEWESAGDESYHQERCPHCGSLVGFQISYTPDIGCEELIENEQEKSG